MTSTSTHARSHAADQAVSRYRRLLVLYPRSFRTEFGGDLLQAYGDLLVFSADRRGLRWRVARDLVASAARERARAMRSADGPSLVTVIGGLGLVLVLLIIGAPGLLLLPAVVLVALPVFGLTRFANAWTIRRTTGGDVRRPVLAGLASFAPATVAMVFLGGDAGYFVFIAISSTLIVAAVAGIIWAGYTLLRSSDDRPRRWTAPLLVLVPSAAVLAFIVGASVNSYLNSLGPPGDHSVENASDDTVALWNAAGAGDVAAVIRLTTQTCADPWVKFPYGNGRHNAKGQAETRAIELPDAQEPPYRRVADILGDYQDEWSDRCGTTN